MGRRSAKSAAGAEQGSQGQRPRQKSESSEGATEAYVLSHFQCSTADYSDPGAALHGSHLPLATLFRACGASFFAPAAPAAQFPCHLIALAFLPVNKKLAHQIDAETGDQCAGADSQPVL